ncbi:outer membrane protein assembly factor BamB family protein [Actinoplanes nipponensis]|uniref:outer membrane protein assembly factor BamB family protein n=1 Tax=Actinoplanes nipponensis TaxID=135950 RepID=UPI0019436835|nr:PQQ-binding-like beta-propeller repeat protein [Actinoplanes nipponensis]
MIRLLRVVVPVVVLAASVLIGWRVLAPAEVLEPATGAYPVAVTLPPGTTGKTTMAPLIVDGRIRVYAGARLVKADGPVQAETMYTPLWSYRRWPQRLAGVVAVAATVVTRWSDGEVVALDGRTGEPVWRAAGPAAGSFTGRTGSAAVWAPPGLHTAGTSVLIAGGRQLTARAAADGTPRWAVTLPPGCGDGFVTAGGRYVCAAGAWDVLTGHPVRGWPNGPFSAVGCDVARSGCAGLRDGSGQGWLTGGRRPERAPRLDAPDATAAGDLVLSPAGGAVTAFRAGREVWRWAGAARVLGARAGRVVLLAADLRAVVLDAATGAQRAAFPLYVPDERVEPWQPDAWQLTDGFLAVQRLGPDAGGFYTTDPVVVAAL